MKTKTVFYKIFAIFLRRRRYLGNRHQHRNQRVGFSIIVDLGTIGGGFSDAAAINERGQVVGSSLATNTALDAFIWGMAQ